MDTLEFFQTLFPSVRDGERITLWTRPDRRSYHVATVEEAAAGALGLDAGGLDVYFGVGLRRAGLSPRARGGIADVVAVTCAWLDLDFGVEGHGGANYPPDEAAALSLLEGLPDPTIVVASGHGLHVYWRYAERVAPAESAAHRSQVHATAAVNAARSGWAVDNTTDAARVLRVPGTHNRKRPDSVAEVEVVFARPDAVVTLSPATSPSRSSAPVGEWARLRVALAEHPSPAVRLAAAGEEIAPSGARNAAWYQVAGDIQATQARLGTDVTPAEIVAGLGAAIPTETLRREVEGQLARQRRRAATERTVGALFPVAAPAAGGYTSADVESWARAAGTTPEGWRRRWIIQHRDTFFVWGRRVPDDTEEVPGYLPPIGGASLMTSLVRDLAPAAGVGVTLVSATEKGTRAKRQPEVLAEYATAARSWVADLTRQRSEYDARAQEFREAVCPRRALAPRYDERVDGWLRLLGSRDGDAGSGRLLDWVATVARLDKITSALYLHGAPGTGKSLLARGLSRIWTLGGPTKIEDAAGQWTHDLARCPLVFADERMPESVTSADFRTLVSDMIRPLRRKYMDNTSLVGALRVVLAANNTGMLSFLESLSVDDAEAVRVRIFYVRIPDQGVREYLESVPAQEFRAWLEDDRIARHALWLAEHRQVAEGHRFLVEGQSAAVVHMLATQGKVPSRVVEWLARYLDRGGIDSVASAGLVLVGEDSGGRLLVNVEALTGPSWGALISDAIQPPTGAISDALRNMSTGSERRRAGKGQRRYHVINAEVVIEWAIQNQIGDEDRMRQFVGLPGLPTGSADSEPF